jgi:hypothetical protein
MEPSGGIEPHPAPTGAPSKAHGDATPGASRGSFTALRYGAIHGIVSDTKSVAERYHWEDGQCWSFDDQSVTQGTLVRLSNA